MARFVAIIVALLTALVAAPALAAQTYSPEVELAPNCHAASDSAAAIPAADVGWICRPMNYSVAKRTAYLRFQAKPGETLGAPKYFVTRVGRFERLTITSVGADGHRVSRGYAMSDIEEFVDGPMFAVEVPQVPGGPAQIFVAFDRPWLPALMSEGYLAFSYHLGWPFSTMLAIALYCGMLLAPLIYNLAFYRVLHQRFVLWHSAMVAGMTIYAATSSGLITWAIDPNFELLTVLMPASFVLPVAMAAFFSADFLEDFALSPSMRRGLRWLGVGSLVIIGGLCLPIAPLRTVTNTLYYASFVVVIAWFVIVMSVAWRRESRAVRFQIAGWSPIIMVGVERIVRGIGTYSAPASIDQLIYLTMGIEVIVTSMGVVDRILQVRRDRDLARAEARTLEEIAERDLLTGLLNRRAVQPNFRRLHEEGFHVMALIDLDRFKAVNDSFGHAVGDDVLVATAKALAPDNDTMAVRLGGEEFLLLLRGPGAMERAEYRRRAVSEAIATRVRQLPGPVTASMGIVEFPPRTSFPIDFAQAYALCDRLLYDAKRNGRDRTESERLLTFDRDEISARSELARTNGVTG